MQFGGFKPSLGVIYNTTMSRPDAALALAMLLGFEGKREARVGGVAVNGAGLGGAMFADAVIRFYQISGPPPNSNRLLPVGLAAEGELPPDPAMVKAPLGRLDDKGEPVYKRGVKRISDTSEVPAMIRNAITAQSEKNSVMILSAPATHLARSLSLTGTRDLAAARVKSLIVVDAPGPKQDDAALGKVLELWPAEVVFVPRELGESLRFPGAAIETDFAWAPAHPVVDAYRSFAKMPYDAPAWDVAAMMYAVHPEHFTVADTAHPKQKTLTLDPAKRDAVMQAAVAIASAKPVVRTPFRPPSGAAAAATEKK